MDYNSASSALQSADLHNTASGNSSFFDDPVSSVIDAAGAAGNFIAKTPTFAITSIASGINSIYNTGVVAGNWLGVTDEKENDLGSTLASYDSDLSQYYNDHKGLVDTSGFLVSSLVPGMAGVKLINAGQKVLSTAIRSGKLGATLADSVGLLATTTKEGKTLGTLAGEALATGEQQFSWLNPAVVKAVSINAGQAAIDSVGFEAMVQATMFRSPVLKDQDYKDIGSNLLTAAVFGGAIGGVIKAAGVYGEVKKVLAAEDLRTLDYRKLSGTFGLEPDQKIVLRAQDLDNIPAGVDTRTTNLAAQTKTRAWQDISSEIHTIVQKGGGDADLGNALIDAAKQAGMQPDGGSQIARMFGGAKAAYRGGAVTEANEGHTLAAVQLHGTEGTGSIQFGGLKASDLTLADKFNSVEKINNFVDSAKFTPGKLWNPVTAQSVDEIEARYIWAAKPSTIKSLKDGMEIHQFDIPLQEAALKAGIQDVRIMGADGFAYPVPTTQDFGNEILQNKNALVEELAKSKKAGWGFNAGAAPDKSVSTITSSEIARAANVSTSAIENDAGASMFARQDALTAFNTSRTAAGLKPVETLDYTPKWAQIAYKTDNATGQNGDLVSAMVNVAQQLKVMIDKAKTAFAQVAGGLTDRFDDIGQDIIRGANRYGAGSSLIASANGTYNSLASRVEAIGKATADLTTQVKQATQDTIGSAALKLRSNQQAAIEFSGINDLRNSTTEKYVLDSRGDRLVAQKVLDYRNSVAAGEKGIVAPTLQEGAPEEYIFKTTEARDATIADITANGSRVKNQQALRVAEGGEDSRNPDVFYGWKADPSNMRFFAFVKDESLTGQAAGHTTMIHAADSDQLAKMIQKIQEIPDSRLKVYTKADAENFYKAKQSYDFDRTIHDNYIDSTLKSAGVQSNFFPKTDANKIVDEWAASHNLRDTLLARDAVAVRYGNEFDQLKQLGEQYTNVAASFKGGTTKAVANTVQNPYQDYIKTALNISRLGEYPLWQSVNRTLETAVNGTIQKISGAWDTVKGVGDLDGINKMLTEAGIQHAYKDAAGVVLANHTAPAPYLSSFVRNANSILAATFLKLDFLNPIANAVGAQVLLGHETSNLVKQSLRDVNAAGVQIPGTGDNILSPFKLIANANKSFITNDNPELAALFKHNSLTIPLNQQLKAMLDDLSLAGTETPIQLNGRIASALQKAKDLTAKGETLTGNKLAEEYNRYVSAHVANQIFDSQLANGTAAEEGRNAFLNTFVNRTQTNTLASQRPLLFQGPVGQAIGLFQSFQFNTMQQLFRSVSEGSLKDTAMALGLQGTLFGLNGLPGFQYINQHILGTLSGNREHTDAYSALYGNAGKMAGDWLMYGIPSNLLQTNLYSRGDINPRTVTVVPLAPQDVVAVSAFGKFAGNLKESFGKIAGGADIWQTFLQGLEHNGLSRPLTGIAQTLQAASNPTHQVFSTTSGGDVNFVNDFMSVATLSRLAGGKPLDEALANDQVARATYYKANDHKNLQEDSEIFKSSLVGSASPQATTEATNNYMANFVHNGGDVTTFNKTMMSAVLKTNTPRANLIIQNLKTNPYQVAMKNLMNGQLPGFDSSGSPIQGPQ